MKTILPFFTAISLAYGVAAADKSQPAPLRNPTQSNSAASPGKHRLEQDQLLARGADFQQVGQEEEALKLYRQAALMGSSEGDFLAGKLSWQTALTAKGKARVLKLDAGLCFFYQAATNGHVGACLNLSQAFYDGTGVRPDLAKAYTWLIIAKRFDPSIPLRALDQWAVKLDAPTLHQAQKNAQRWLEDGWTGASVPRIIQGDPRFKVNGFCGGNIASVMINRKTFVEGDSAAIAPLMPLENNVKPGAGTVEITCASIGQDYVLVKIAGEDSRRLLALDFN